MARQCVWGCFCDLRVTAVPRKVLSQLEDLVWVCDTNRHRVLPHPPEAELPMLKVPEKVTTVPGPILSGR